MRRDRNSRPAIIRLSGMSLFYSRLFERAAEGIEVGAAIESIDAFVAFQKVNDRVGQGRGEDLIHDLEKIAPKDELSDEGPGERPAEGQHHEHGGIHGLADDGRSHRAHPEMLSAGP